ncbi:uncharacterized protein CCOS01_12598 [Colletotrichum costaricense]|uniref:Uncharacterized protein n=1 Tax=Colletotrichum costaricense TaxID=1209916 RepID=A0AAI9YNP7_9PEZI|nr:uncharacterized protein CCOS01_12598 [Colletotrichum costaricense]KAK1517049.1 hypothetical protein CCOS01_12598 [Colletotrichum costaricense]
MSELNEPLVWERKGREPSEQAAAAAAPPPPPLPLASRQAQRRRPTCKRGTSIFCYVVKDYTPSPGSKTLGIRCWTMDGGMDGEVD